MSISPTKVSSSMIALHLRRAAHVTRPGLIALYLMNKDYDP